MIRRLLRLAGPAGSNTIFGTGWQLLRLLFQLVTVTIVARSLGPQGYGTFAGYAGLGAFLAGLTGLGTGTLLIRDVARRPEVWGARWYAMLRLGMKTCLAQFAVFIIAAHFILRAPLPASALLSIGISELVAYPMVYLASFAFQAFERIGWATALATLTAALRMSGALVFLALAQHGDIRLFSVIYLTTSITAGLVALLSVRMILKPPHSPGARFTWPEIRHSLVYCWAGFTTNGLVELDKILTVRFAGPSVAAVYTIGYRFMSALATPVATLALAVQPKLFRDVDRAETVDTRRRLRIMLLVATFLGIAGASAMFICAGLVPRLFGERYVEVSHAIRLLVFVPIVYSLRLVGSTALTSLGLQRSRAALESLALATMIILAWAIMPRLALMGAAIMITATETLLMLGALILVTLHFARPRASRPSLDAARTTGKPR